MNTTSVTRSIGGAVGAAIFVVGLFALAPNTNAAQDQPQAQGERGPRGGRGFGGPGGPMGGPMGGGFGAVMRDLTDAQRAQVKTIRERHADQIRPLAERAQAARDALNTAVLAANTGNLQALSIEIGSAETELAFAQGQIQAEIFAVLTPEQKQKVAEQRKEMEARRAEMMKRRANRVP